LACLCILAAGLAEAQPQTAAAIYSCKDARGHTITADRPIADCFDRAQRELSASGALRRTVGPATSAIEEDQRIERARRAEALQQANSEERRRDRALLARYATPQAHARERAAALAQVDAVMDAARVHIDSLHAERRRIDEELAFYSEPRKAPAALQRRLDDNIQAIAAQNRFLEEEGQSRRRIDARFDDEHARLAGLWKTSASAMK
jgi:hypothetical protein